MFENSFWRKICLARFYTTEPTTRLLPAPKRSYSFHCANCGYGISAECPIYMRMGHSYCSERCRALAPETEVARDQLCQLESKVRRRVWNASPHGSSASSASNVSNASSVEEV